MHNKAQHATQITESLSDSGGHEPRFGNGAILARSVVLARRIDERLHNRVLEIRVH
jgi:hypothetical protein